MVYDCVHCSTGNGVCLEDPPIGGKLNASALEGLNFDADAQCRAVHGATARFCSATFAIEVSLPPHTHTHTYTYIHTHTHTYTHIHIHTHTHIQALYNK